MLANIKPLKSLTIQGFDVNDEVVEDKMLDSLERMKSLEYLDVNMTRLRDAGMKKLRKRLPDCVVYKAGYE